MKTHDVIKKGLACCAEYSKEACVHCPYLKGCGCDSFEECNLYRDALAYINQLEARLASVGKTCPEWISVKDRLPTESDGTVLVCFPDVFPYNSKEHFVNAKHDQRVKTATYSEHSRKWYIGDMASVGSIDPTHWMPMPEIPKEE